jgi:hypothetical protein
LSEENTGPGPTLKTLMSVPVANSSQSTNVMMNNMRFSTKKRQGVPPTETLGINPSQKTIVQSSHERGLHENLSRWVSEKNIHSFSRKNSQNYTDFTNQNFKIGEQVVNVANKDDFNQTPKILQTDQVSGERLDEHKKDHSANKSCANNDKRLDIKQLLSTPYTYAPHLRMALKERI